MNDWDGLSEKLKALGVKLGKSALPASKPKGRFPIEKVVDGSFREVIYGQIFCHVEDYPSGHLHGEKPLFPADPLDNLCRWAKANLYSQDDLQDFIFLDTETSGLSGGTGTYAFEVGLGRFTENGFKLAQFFMRHPGEEPALLAGLTEFMHGMKAVVTYNGKSFDIPLLNTRYTMMGMASPFEGIDHFDLLPLARRLWRLRLESRTLGSVETNILGVKRGEGEVPGYMIPELYFDFLKTKDARPMAGIFYHNAIDILSLAGIFSHTAYLLNEPLSKDIPHHEDLVSLGRFFEAQGDIPQAELLYRRALDVKLEDNLYWDTLSRLSFLHKRREDWALALNLWEQAADNDLLYAFEELAKYFEHRSRDLREAQKWTMNALVVLENHHFPAYEYTDWRQRLEHRLDRLKRRIARMEKG